jgi:hypothetical protein
MYAVGWDFSQSASGIAQVEVVICGMLGTIEPFSAVSRSSFAIRDTAVCGSLISRHSSGTNRSKLLYAATWR